MDSAFLESELSALRDLVASLQRRIAVLEQENAELRRRLGLNSENSSKPPSSDGLAKKPRIAGSLREKGEKPGGGQPGHKGATLRRVENPDHIERHEAACCAHCQAALSALMVIGKECRQVFDIPAPRLEVTEHQAQIYRCEACQGSTKARFPKDIVSATQYGPRIKAAAVYLNTQHLIPEDRTAEVMHDLFGAPLLCPASIVNWSVAYAAALAPVTGQIATLLDRACVRHLDETSFRIGGKTCWLHTTSALSLTLYRVTDKRGDVAQTLEGGVIVHDHFKSYNALARVQHAFCNAHHLRELKALIDIEKEPWALKMFRLLKRANRAVQKARAEGKTMLAEYRTRRFQQLYDAIIKRGIEFHKAMQPLVRKEGARGKDPQRPGHNLLIRLRDRKNDVLRFLTDFTVPFTNNLAEQDIRMMKVKMKISGGFRTRAGAEIFATIRSVISTARKRGWNILQTLAKPAKQIITALETA